MSIQEHFFTVSRTARVYTFGNLSEHTKIIWLVTHGYGQLAQFFLKHFEHLNPNTNFVIAPEALSRSYLDGMSGRVGASWMTKEMRAEEIKDYVEYIENIVDNVLGEVDMSERKLIALGFSQGAATISRWAVKSKRNVNLLCFWAGEPGNEIFSLTNSNIISTLYVVGTNDPFLTFEKQQMIKLKSNESNWKFDWLSFEGEHHLDKKMLLTIEEMVQQNGKNDL
jgi:predicted esterase